MSSDAGGAWEGQDLTKAKRALISVTSFLGLLTIFYAAFTFCADSWQITSAGLAAAVLIALVAWLLSRRWPDQAVPSAAAAKFVGITSGIEGITITVAFILGGLRSLVAIPSLGADLGLSTLHVYAHRLPQGR